jgi:hypothetical protein
MTLWIWIRIEINSWIRNPVFDIPVFVSCNLFLADLRSHICQDHHPAFLNEDSSGPMLVQKDTWEYYDDEAYAMQASSHALLVQQRIFFTIYYF